MIMIHLQAETDLRTILDQEVVEDEDEGGGEEEKKGREDEVVVQMTVENQLVLLLSQVMNFPSSWINMSISFSMCNEAVKNRTRS